MGITGNEGRLPGPIANLGNQNLLVLTRSLDGSLAYVWQYLEKQLKKGIQTGRNCDQKTMNIFCIYA